MSSDQKAQTTAEQITSKNLTVPAMFRAAELAAYTTIHGQGVEWDIRTEFRDGSAIVWLLDCNDNPRQWSAEIPESAPQGPEMVSKESACLAHYEATLSAQIADIKALARAVEETTERVRDAALAVRAARISLL